MKPLAIFNNQFQVQKKISSGSFGVVLLGADIINNLNVAIKIEKEENEEAKSLDREAMILQRLNDTDGVPRLYWIGQQDQMNILVLQLLGKDLAFYMKNKRRFSNKTTIQLGIQITQVLERIHDKGIIHRDLKPENILFGIDHESTKIYVIDYGISKVNVDRQGNQLPFREGASFIGTTRYASIAAHKGQELSRKDDLESLIYILLYFLKGQLPWQNLVNVTDDERTKKVGDLKMQINEKELCKDVPQEFQIILEYVKRLQYSNKPDYEYIYELFERAASNLDIQLTNQFDWEQIILPRKHSTNEMTKSQDLKLNPDNNMKKSLDKFQPLNTMKQSLHHRQSLLAPPIQLHPPLLRRQDSQQPSQYSGSFIISQNQSIKPNYEISKNDLNQDDEQNSDIMTFEEEKGIKKNNETYLVSSLEKPPIGNLINNAQQQTETVAWKDCVFEENFQEDPLSKKYGILKRRSVAFSEKSRKEFKKNNNRSVSHINNK